MLQVAPEAGADSQHMLQTEGCFLGYARPTLDDLIDVLEGEAGSLRKLLARHVHGLQGLLKRLSRRKDHIRIIFVYFSAHRDNPPLLRSGLPPSCSSRRLTHCPQ